MTFGTGKSGQLGHGEPADQKLPRVVEGLQGRTIVDIVCGKGACDGVSLAAAWPGQPRVCSPVRRCPAADSHGRDLRLAEHTLVLTDDNRVFGFGYDQYGTHAPWWRHEAGHSA